SPATLAGGASSTTVTFQAVAQGTSVITVVTPSGFSTAVANHLTATVSQPHISINPASVGYGLQVIDTGSLEAPAPSSGLTVTITSSDTSKVLLSTDVSGTTAGSGSITLHIAAGMGVSGAGFGTFWIQGGASSGSATLTASAPGFASATATVNLTPSGFVLTGPGGTSQPFNTTTLSSNSTITVFAEQLDSSFNAIGRGVVAGGMTVTVPVATNNTAGTIVQASGGPTLPVTFHGNDTQKVVAFHPFTQGSDTIAVGAPSVSGYSNASPSSQIPVTVTQPHITLNSMTLGQNLQASQIPSIDAPAPGGGLHITVSSPDPNVILSTSSTVVGSSSVTLNVAAGSQIVPTLWVQGIGQTGTITLTATAPAFASATAAITLTPSTIAMNGPTGIRSTFPTNTKAPDTSLTVVTFQLDPATLTPSLRQQLRAGLSINSTVSSSDTTVGTISSTTTATIVGGSDT